MNTVTIRYCKKCKEILFVWDDLVIEYCSYIRYMTEDGSEEYGDSDMNDSKKEGEVCRKHGHESIIHFRISKESFKKIWSDALDSIPIEIPEEFFDEEIPDEEFNTILLEAGVAKLSGGK